MGPFFSNIRTWIVIFFLLRLFGITNPPLEVAHHWRQTTVTMVARNFVETGPELFFPKIDFAGEKTGITGMEFPLLNYLIYIVSQAFGYAHWYGRLINLLVSSIGLFYFYRIIKKYFAEPVAFHATLILLFSVWFSYSRKIMPDTFSMSLVIAGLFYGSNYLDRKQRVADLAAYFLLVTFGILSKLPAGYLLILIPVVMDRRSFSANIIFSVTSLAIVSIVCAYYFYWVPLLNRTYEFDHFFMGKGLSEGITDIVTHWDEALEKFYEEALGYAGFLVFLPGLVYVFLKRQKALAIVFSFCFLAFLGVIFKGGFAFYHHSYYIIPFAPVMALIGGFALSELRNKNLAVAVLIVIAAESIVTKNSDFYIKEKNLALLNLEADLSSVGARKDLILVNSGNIPTPVYFAHRKGWIEHNENIARNDYIDSLQHLGLKYIVILKRTLGTEIRLERRELFSNEDYTIYGL